MPLTLSHGGPTVNTAATPSREVLVGTQRGVVTIARDDAGRWSVASRTLEDLHISVLLIDPSGVIFAGAYKGGLWASDDNGKTWARRDSGLTQDDIYSIARRPTDGRLYVGTEPAHLFYSDDLGVSWTELPNVRNVPGTESWSFPAPPHVAHLKHITFDPDDATTMYASIEVGGLLKSTDGGEAWSVLDGMYEDVHRLVVTPGMNGMFVTGGNGLYASVDGGSNWEHRTDRKHEFGGYPDQLVYRPSSPDTMIIAAAQDNPGTWRESHSAGARIARSNDAGRSWDVLTAGLPDRMQGNVEAMCLEEAAGRTSIFAATTAGEVIASEDGGETWSVIVEGLAPISKAGHYRNLTPANA